MRSKFRRRTALGQQHASLTQPTTGQSGRFRETTEPISYADATRHASTVDVHGNVPGAAPSSVRRRRVKTTSPDMEFGSRGSGRSASWSRARQRELKELLSSRMMGEAYASSVEEEGEEEEEGEGRGGGGGAERDGVDRAGGPDVGKMPSNELSPRQRSSTFPAVLGKLPTFKLGRSSVLPRDGKHDVQVDHQVGVDEDALGLGLGLRSGSGLGSRSSSGRGRSRLSRWLSPDPTMLTGGTNDGTTAAPPITGFSHSGTPVGGGTSEDEDEDDDLREGEGDDGYSLPSESSTDDEGDEAIYDGGMMR